MKLRHITFAVIAAWVGAEGIGGSRTPWTGAADPRLVLREWVLEMHRTQVDAQDRLGESGLLYGMGSRF